MSIRIKSKTGRVFTFEGPYYSPDSLDREPGIYAILCDEISEMKPIKTGHSENMRRSVEEYLKNSKLKERCPGTLKFGQMRIKESTKRTQISKEIKA